MTTLRVFETAPFSWNRRMMPSVETAARTGAVDWEAAFAALLTDADAALPQQKTPLLVDPGGGDKLQHEGCLFTPRAAETPWSTPTTRPC